MIPRVPRKTPSRRFSSLSGGNLREAGVPAAAVVDITTKDLYDRIEFLDVDGGAWKQGWQVTYDVHEWDSEKLKVFVVPHSHNDPGWKQTVDEYYDSQSRRILDTIVESLSKVCIRVCIKLTSLQSTFFCSFFFLLSCQSNSINVSSSRYTLTLLNCHASTVLDFHRNFLLFI